MMRRLVIIGLVSLGIFLTGRSIGISEEIDINAIKEDIKIEVEGGILHYQRESFWDEKGFYEILNSKVEFVAKELNSFKRDVRRYGRNIVNPKIEFDESKRVSILLCDVKGTKEGYWYDFDWFLRPLGLDFLDDHFERKDMELYWKGKVRGIETIINIKFSFPISNCHEHVWRR